MGYSALDRDATPADALPAAFLEATKVIDKDTSRFVGKDEGASFWIAKSNEPGGVCLIFHAADEDWGSVCGAGIISLSLSSGTTYALYPDGMPTPDDKRKISENVFATTDNG